MKKSEISYNEAVADIEEIIEKLNDNNMDIDELAKEVKRASELITICKDKLRDTNKAIDKIYNPEEK